MCSNHIKLRVISFFLLYSWLVTACGGSEVLCVETQGKAEFEYGWMTECYAPSVSVAADCPTLTCDKCKHYPFQLCAVHRNRDCKAAFAENLFHIPQLHGDMDEYAKIAYQSFLPIPTDMLITIVLVI
jgi:hypothetical protein